MKDRHIDPQDFFQALFFYGRHEERPAWEIHLHFLKRCPVCLGWVLAYFGLESVEELETLRSPWGDLGARSEEARSAPLLGWLDTLPEGERLQQARTDPKLHQGYVVESLLRRCRKRWAREPARALEDTRLAQAILPHLSPHSEAVSLILGVEELTARVWAYRGNVLRILSDLSGAEEAFLQAKAALVEGWFEERVPAEVLALEASLLGDQGRFQEALETVDDAIGLYRLIEEWHLQGRQLLKRAKIRVEAGEMDGVLEDLRRGVALLEPSKEPRLRFVAASIELHLYCETGRTREARALAPEARRLAEEHGSRSDRLRVRWCEGRIAAGEAAGSEAEEAFSEVRAGFLDQDNAYDAALVSLDLVLLYLRQGRTGEVKELAGQMLPIFESREVHAHALAALILFHDAARQEQATTDFVRELGAYLRRARFDPSLRFRELPL